MGGRESADEDAQRRMRWIKWLDTVAARKKCQAGHATNDEFLEDSPIDRSTWFRWRAKYARWQKPTT